MAETHSNADAQAADDRVVKKSITVPLAPASVLQLWTAGIHRWWPPGHSRSGDPGTQVFSEEGVGGCFMSGQPPAWSMNGAA
ncbi:MAG: hypothetical protein R2932_03995 [Caldilineaceae bacterium]